MAVGAERGFNRRSCGYFSDVLTATNLVLRTVPMPLTVVTITMLMPAAIIQYSIAVAPVSSLRNFEMSCRIKTPVGASHRVFSRTVGPNLGWIGCRCVHEHAELSVKGVVDLYLENDGALRKRQNSSLPGIHTGPKIYL